MCDVSAPLNSDKTSVSVSAVHAKAKLLSSSHSQHRVLPEDNRESESVSRHSGLDSLGASEDATSGNPASPACHVAVSPKPKSLEKFQHRPLIIKLKIPRRSYVKEYDSDGDTVGGYSDLESEYGVRSAASTSSLSSLPTSLATHTTLSTFPNGLSCGPQQAVVTDTNTFLAAITGRAGSISPHGLEKRSSVSQVVSNSWKYGANQEGLVRETDTAKPMRRKRPPPKENIVRAPKHARKDSPTPARTTQPIKIKLRGPSTSASPTHVQAEHIISHKGCASPVAFQDPWGTSSESHPQRGAQAYQLPDMDVPYMSPSRCISPMRSMQPTFSPSGMSDWWVGSNGYGSGCIDEEADNALGPVVNL